MRRRKATKILGSDVKSILLQKAYNQSVSIELTTIYNSLSSGD